MHWWGQRKNIFTLDNLASNESEFWFGGFLLSCDHSKFYQATILVSFPARQDVTYHSTQSTRLWCVSGLDLRLRQ